MLGVTIFGLLFTPVFYVIARKFAGGGKSMQAEPARKRRWWAPI